MVHSPKIVHLNILDTDYAKIAAGEVIPEERRQRLAWGESVFKRLSQQIARYRYDDLDCQGRDDLLCSIAMTAELFTLADLEDINDRLRHTGTFYLTPGERQQIVNWLRDELAIDLMVNPDL
ncbi:MAG: hypothetical protein O3C67_06665 [Cyanobacteria bacterium]|nr:hypothetical protein [Cyanobacteriota bacterium]MEB3269608.1 hypothetical protein [Leptolyngbya sp.]